MKRFLAILGGCLLAFTLLACGKNNTTEGKKKTVIKYCGWNLGTSEDNNTIQQLINSFNKKSEDIRIEVMRPEGNYDEFITTMASGKNLPDVFMVNSVPKMATDRLALDISDLVNADPEWQDVEVGLRNSITYGDSVYAIPASQEYIGYYVNYDLLDDYINYENYFESGAQIPSTTDASDIFAPGNFTTDQFITAVKEVRSSNLSQITNGTGVVGLDKTGDMINWLPASLDTEGKIKHFVWDGYKFDLTGQVMKDALSKIQNLGSKNNPYTFSSIPEFQGEGDNKTEYRKQIFGSSDEQAVFQNGQMGFRSEGTWSDSNYSFNYKFIGLPDQKVIAAADYYSISASTKNKEAAYEVAKYLSFGIDGLNDRFSIVEANKDNDKVKLTGLPINTKEEVKTKWFNYVKLPGTKEVFEKVSDGTITVLVEGNKVVPGFQSARFDYKTGISIANVRDGAELSIGDFIWDTCGGDISLNEYSTNMTTTVANNINKIIDDAYKKMGINRTSN